MIKISCGEGSARHHDKYFGLRLGHGGRTQTTVFSENTIVFEYFDVPRDWLHYTMHMHQLSISLTVLKPSNVKPFHSQAGKYMADFGQF